jgi:putative tryptophan/tyrosine transport system substrate-binding protein
MKRREFITLVGSAAAAWPLVARAQQGERVRRVGVLLGLAENDPEAQSWLGGFRQGLEKLGWLQSNLLIDYRYARGSSCRLGLSSSAGRDGCGPRAQ